MSVGLRPGSRAERSMAASSAFVFVFLYAPILVLFFYSFNENDNVGIWTEFSFRWYGEMFQNDAVMGALRNSLVVALVSTVVSTVLGTATALALERFRFRGRGFFDGLSYLPVIIPDVTMAVMMLLFFVSFFRLLAGAGMAFEFGLGTISLSHIAFNISFVAIVVRAKLAQLDTSLEEAAADLYADRWTTFRLVTLPLIMPAVLGGALLALTLSLDDVVVTSFVSGPGATTLPVYVFGLVRRGVTPLINAVSVVMLAASISLVLFSLVFQRRGAEES
ncbi:MAG: ABC transporter permease [Acidimicrobiia bacterium]|nr:MAG: ABC transporter permease [Acidimicrobiia bacterium]